MNKLKSQTKLDRVLESFMDGRSYNRFEAERLLNDHCLHSTVSSIQKKYGDVVSREWEMVPGYRGSPTRVRRYWIPPENKGKILEIEFGKKEARINNGRTDEKIFVGLKSRCHVGAGYQQIRPER